MFEFTLHNPSHLVVHSLYWKSQSPYNFSAFWNLLKLKSFKHVQVGICWYAPNSSQSSLSLVKYSVTVILPWLVRVISFFNWWIPILFPCEYLSFKSLQISLVFSAYAADPCKSISSQGLAFHSHGSHCHLATIHWLTLHMPCGEELQCVLPCVLSFIC